MRGSGRTPSSGFTTGDDVEGGDGSDTLTLAATSLGLNAALDGALTGVEIVSAALAAAGVIIDLGLQSDGFTITGSGHGDTITGSSAADIIDAGLGADTIVGFTTGDDVEGGDGSDTLTLAATSLGLNAALDGALTGVEIVSAALAAAAVRHRPRPSERRLHDHRQRPRRHHHRSSAADTIDAGLGADTIVGFTTGDDVEGGDGSDTLTLAATSLGLNAALDGR